MIRSRFLTALCLGTFVYVVVSLIGGQNGFWAERQLRNQKRSISARTAEIQTKNDELKLEYIALKNDKNVIAAYARRLDYVADGEKLVKIRGLASSAINIYDTGTVLHLKKIRFIPEWFCKASGLAIFCLSYIILFLLDYNNGLVKKRTTTYHSKIEGIPLYDVPQI